MILLVVAVAGIGGVKYFAGGSVVDQENAPATRGQADVRTPPGLAGERRAQRRQTWPEERQEGS